MVQPAATSAPWSITAPWPFFAEDEIEAAVAVLRSGKVNYWTGGEGRAFEQEVAASSGTKYGVAMMNGSVAIEAALVACGVQPGDEVIVTPRSFMASASSAVLVGARPVFADIDRRTGNLDPAAVERVLTPKTKAIVAVHLAGWPCDMDRLRDLAESKGIVLVEDCAQAHGATWRGRPVGGLGTLATWSYCQDKILTTGGEGGAITTNEEHLWRECWELKDHGKSYEAVYHREHAPGYRWLHERFASNWRMTEVQSSIGRVILRKLGGWVAARRRNAERLLQGLADLAALRLEHPAEHEGHAYYKFYAYVRPEALASGWSRDRIMAEVEQLGVPCYSGSCSELYREKAFRDSGFVPPEPLPVAQELGETSLMLLVHPTLTDDHLDQAIAAVRQVVGQATR